MLICMAKPWPEIKLLVIFSTLQVAANGGRRAGGRTNSDFTIRLPTMETSIVKTSDQSATICDQVVTVITP